MTTIVHELSNEAMLLLTRHNAFAEKNSVAKINIETATRLAYHMFEDTVNSLMLWLNDTFFFHDYMGELFKWYSPVGAESRIADDYYCDVYDPVWLQISQSVGVHIPGETYYMWSVSRAHDFALLVKGDDYRLIEWHRLMDAKRITPPSRKRQWRAH
jgi:hypothetical protein